MARLIDLSPDERSWARGELPGSRPQRLLHNFLVQRIEEYRNRLETTPADEIVALQASIRECRTLLGELHAYDPEDIKRMYEHLPD